MLYLNETFIRHHLGEHREAIALLEDLSIPWAPAGPLATEAVAYAAMGMEDKARELLEWLRQEQAHRFFIGLVLAALDDRQEALDVFKTVDDRSMDDNFAIIAARYLFPAELGPLREHQSFTGMIRRLDATGGLD